jgi:hypothetical protein
MIGDKEIEEMFRGHWSETFEGMDDQGLFRYYHLGRQDRISGYAANHAHGYFVGFKACQELMQKRIEELEKQNEIMREALGFYAEPWERGELDGELLVRRLYSYDCFKEVHIIAQEALKKIEEK